MRACACVVLLFIVVATACAPTVDLTKGLQVQNVSTGWFDAGIVNGQNKLVPSISFALRNASALSLGTLQVNALFHRVGEKGLWDDGFLTAAGSEGLTPGATTARLTIRSRVGYTGSDTREEMLGNSHFVDAEVELFAKYGATQWKRIGQYPVTRMLISK